MIPSWNNTDHPWKQTKTRVLSRMSRKMRIHVHVGIDGTTPSGPSFAQVAAICPHRGHRSQVSSPSWLWWTFAFCDALDSLACWMMKTLDFPGPGQVPAELPEGLSKNLYPHRPLQPKMSPHLTSHHENPAMSPPHCGKSPWGKRPRRQCGPCLYLKRLINCQADNTFVPKKIDWPRIVKSANYF